MELLGEINREHSRGGVISDPLEDFREIRDPERGLESGADLAQSLCKTQLSSSSNRVHTVRSAACPPQVGDCIGTSLRTPLEFSWRASLRCELKGFRAAVDEPRA